MKEEWKDAYGNTNKLGMTKITTGLYPIPQKYNPLRHLFLCSIAKHWWGVDGEYGFVRVCARCGKFEQITIEGTRRWVSRKKWKKIHNIKE